MAMEYWGIVGEGIPMDAVDFKKLNAKKIVERFEKIADSSQKEMASDVLYDKNSTIEDIIDAIEESFDWGFTGFLTYGYSDRNIIATSDGGDKWWILFPALMPWEIKQSYPTTQDGVKTIMCEIMENVGDFSMEDVLRMYDSDVCTYGCG